MNRVKFWIDAVWFKNEIHEIACDELWVLSHYIDDLFDNVISPAGIMIES